MPRRRKVSRRSRRLQRPVAPVADRRTVRRRILRVAVTAAMALVLLFSLQVGVSVVGAMRTPGNASFKAKWADWLRDHHGAGVVNALETVYFSRSAPPKGGSPKGGLQRVAPPLPLVGSGATASAGVDRGTQPSVPAPVRLATASGIPGEGQWQPTGPVVNGRPGLYVTQVRPDSVHTSVLVSLAWMDMRLFRLHLMPGTQEPKGQFREPSAIEGTDLAKVAAGFNSGFRFKDGAGGFYLDGKQAVPLQDGKASLVIYKDGHVDVGQWGREVKLSSDVVAVRQNLVLLVDKGKPVPNLNPNDHLVWGDTLKGSVLVPRSGVCVDANGGLIYIAGPGLNITTLADTMARAGCMRGMELDINPEWVTFNIFDHQDAANPSKVHGRKLSVQQQATSTRYLAPNSRDFFMLTVA